MFVWNPPVSAIPVLRFSYERRIQIMEDPTDTFDMPEDWYEAITWNLAKRLIPKFGCTIERAAEIRANATESLDIALGFDSAPYPITVNMREH